jgi:hypothetical protein
MGYLPPPVPLRLNLDRFGMPRDYATYVWLLYRRHVGDSSPARRAFLHGAGDRTARPAIGVQLVYR